MAARKKKATKKKTTTKTVGAITITDPNTQKSAALSDPQAVRAVLIDLVTRLGTHGAQVDERDSSEMVAVEILAKCNGSAVEAGNFVRDAENLAEIFAGTVLEEATKTIPTKGDRPAKQVPLPRGKDLELVKKDAGDAIEELWGMFCSRIEASEGEVGQTMTLTATWFPPTGNRDGYVGVTPTMTVKGKKKTRTGTVTKKKKSSGGGYQFSLFAEPAE